LSLSLGPSQIEDYN